MASIAKLAIQIVTDTTRMVAGLRDGQTKLRSFESEVATGAFKAGAALQIAGKAIQFAARSAQQWFLEGVRMQDQLAKLTGQTQTFSTEWQRLRDRIGIGALPAAGAGQGFLTGIQAAADALQAAAGFTPTGAVQAEMAAAAKESERLDKSLKESNERIKEQVREAERAKEAMKRQADQVAASVRTPFEVMVDAFAELQKFQDAGLVDATTFARRADQIAKSFRDAKRSVSEIKLPTRVGAVERGTTAEVSARLAGMDALNAGVRELVAEQKRNRVVNEQILKAVEKSGVRLNKGAF